MTFIIVLPILGYLLYRLVLYPRFFSPLRHIPGPPLGHPITGQFGAILRGEAGIPQREWVKQYGPVVRVVGPVGIERLIFMTPEAIHKILVSDWVEYPRVRLISFPYSFLTLHSLHSCAKSWPWSQATVSSPSKA